MTINIMLPFLAAAVFLVPAAIFLVPAAGNWRRGAAGRNLMRMIYRVPAGNIDAIRDNVNGQYTGRSQNVLAYLINLKALTRNPLALKRNNFPCLNNSADTCPVRLAINSTTKKRIFEDGHRIMSGERGP